MENSFGIVRQVCEHAQASGMIKSLADAIKISQALQTIAAGIEDLKQLKIEVQKLQQDKAKSELHS